MKEGFLGRFGIIKKMTFLLVLIIAMFSGIMTYSAVLATNMRARYVANYEWLRGFLAINIAGLSVAVILILLIFLPTALRVKKQVAQLEDNAKAVKHGDFSVVLRTSGNDEVSRISNALGEIVDTFSGIIGDIQKTANDIKNGKLESRMKETDFQGEFRLAAASVNTLAGKVVEAADLKEFEASMRREFARSQKNAVQTIADAFARGDMRACLRAAHTLKGLAYTIRENDLGDIAGNLERIFEKNEDADKVPGLIKALADRLALILYAIRIEQGGLSDLGDAAGVAKILEDLEPLLHGSNAGALEVAMQLKSVPQAAILVRQLEVFDFDAALTSLSTLKEIAAT